MERFSWIFIILELYIEWFKTLGGKALFADMK